MKRIRGMHESSSPQVRRGSRRKPDRNQLTMQLSRLEHQHMLLERQLAVWSEKKDTTAHRIGLIEKQVADLERELLAGFRHSRTATRRVAVNGRGARDAELVAAVSARREMPFEY